MRKLRAPLLVVCIAFATPAGSQTTVRPLDFFQGTTVSEGTLRVALKDPVRTRSVSRGSLEPNGTLVLVQRVEDEGEPPRERRWRIRQTGPRTYSGTMSEASGPVTVEQVGARYRFRFKMKGNLSVEQWLAPQADGRSARSNISVRKFGLVVATSQATIRKVAGA
jgi:hypothetical protein